MKKKITLLLFIILVSIHAIGQYSITGIVLNQETLKPVSDAHIKVGGLAAGTTTTVEGLFKLKVEQRKVYIEISSIGYTTKNIPVKIVSETIDIGTILLQAHPYSLDEISINAGLSMENDLPVSVSSINARTIEHTIGDQPLPMVLQNTSGVFSVRVGGGSGDSRISIRGFHQENVSLLLNGIPINGEENGLVYWNNWLGLSNVAAEIQIQKGAGIANASIYAVGGSVNIITKNSKKEKSGSIGTSISSYGNISTNIVINSGKLKNGWNTSLQLSLGAGPGYVDATYVRSMSYFFTANKELSKRHSLNINLLGAPERHGQRTIKLSSNEVELKGTKFNKDWGGFNGQIKNASENFYHKPFFTIDDDFKINDKNLLSTSVYITAGYGGGLWSESFNYAPSIFSYRDYSDQLDWTQIYENNATHEQSYTLENGETVSGYSNNVQTKFMASHVQAGLMSNYEHTINDNFKLLAGIHYGYFNSFVSEKVADLLGGSFFIEDYAWSLAGVAGRNQIKTVGDIIKVNNSSIINYANTWGQAVYNTSKINTFISVSLNNNWYKRIDRYNYITNTESEVVQKPGFDLRAGFLYNINEYNGIYVNGSFISKAPYFKYVFGNYTNVVVSDLKNETAKSIELGYKLKLRSIRLNLTGYLTQRNDVSMLSNEYVQLENNDQTRAMIVGLNSLNSGLELDFNMDISRDIKFGGWASIGSFKWQNNVSAKLFNDNNIIVDTVNVYAKNLFIGGTAQNQAGIFADLFILKTLFLKVEYQYFNGIYADFDPTSRNNPNDNTQPYGFPSYGVLNSYLGIPFKLNKIYGRLQINAYNIIDTKYIVMGEDGINHDLETFRGFWSFGRNLSFGLTLNF